MSRRGRRRALSLANAADRLSLLRSAPELEFSYAAGTRRRPLTRPVDADTWAGISICANRRGVHAERWRHTHGCALLQRAARHHANRFWSAVRRRGPHAAGCGTSPIVARVAADRARQVARRWPRYAGSGDTLLGVAANGSSVRALVGYHRPRGCWAPAEEPNARVGRTMRTMYAERARRRSRSMRAVAETEPLACARLSTMALNDLFAAHAGVLLQDLHVAAPAAPLVRVAIRRAAGPGRAPSAPTPIATPSGCTLRGARRRRRPGGPPRRSPRRVRRVCFATSKRTRVTAGRARRDDRREPAQQCSMSRHGRVQRDTAVARRPSATSRTTWSVSASASRTT
jgi:sarcosine oxidase subunit delta